MNRRNKGRHHSAHSGRHSRPGNRVPAKIRRKQIIGSVLLCTVVVVVLLGLAWGQMKRQESMQITAGNSHDVKSGYRDIEYKGQKYRYNNLVTCVLYAGIDSKGKMEATTQYGNKARADSIGLAVIDQLHKKLTVVAINRDTMTKIRRYSMTGNDDGLYTSHVGYAYSYGDGGDVSCENLCEAVSRLFGNIPVREYVVTNQDSMPYINNLMGGITLTVPNNDLKDLHPELYEGAQVTLNDDNIVDFLQHRDTEEKFSNEGRMERQKSYVSAYIHSVQNMDTDQIYETWDSLKDMEDHLQTSITRNKYLDFIEKLKDLEFSEENYVQLDGTDKEGELHDEFYPDVEALQERIIELFYVKV